VYGIAVTEAQSQDASGTGIYSITLPAGITNASKYFIQFRRSSDNSIIYTYDFLFDGTNEVVIGTNEVNALLDLPETIDGMSLRQALQVIGAGTAGPIDESVSPGVRKGLDGTTTRITYTRTANALTPTYSV
jgi:hypothetical protein